MKLVCLDTQECLFSQRIEQISILCGCLQEKISNGFSILWPSPSHGSKCVWKKNLETYATEDFPVILDFSC